MTTKPSGIFMPVMASKFRVDLDTNDIVINEQFMHAVESVKLDMLKKQFTIVAREDVTGSVMNCIRIFLIEKSSIIVNMLDSKSEVTLAINFINSKVIDHSFVMSYADGDTSKHVLVSQYDSIMIKSRFL